MARNNSIICHTTEISKLDNGWCYQCKTCGYRAAYTCLPDGTMKLVVEFTGNGNGTGNIEYNMDPHLQEQVEAILEKYSRLHKEW